MYVNNNLYFVVGNLVTEIYIFSRRSSHLCRPVEKSQLALFPSFEHYSFCSAHNCSILSLGGKVNTRLMSKPDMESIIHIKNQWNILVIGNYYVNYQNYQNVMLLSSSGTKRTLMHLFMFTNSAQRELGSDMYAEYTQLQLTFLAL